MPGSSMTASKVLQERLASEDHGRCPVRVESAHRSGPSLDPAVIGFEPVVGVLGRAVARTSLQLADCLGQDREATTSPAASLAAINAPRGWRR